jgi:hypothetical protein
MKTCKLFLPLLLMIGLQHLFARDKILLKEKTGTFKITYSALDGLGPDQYNKSCGYTKA